MVDSIAKMLTVVMVFIAAVFLLTLFGHGIASGIPAVADFVRYTLSQLWGALERIVHFGQG